MSKNDRLSGAKVPDTDKALKEDQNIQEKMRKIILLYIDKHIDDPDFMDSLPASTRATIIMQYLPKAKDNDRDLNDKYFTLCKSLELLPEIVDITKKIRAMTVAHRQLEIKMVTLELERDHWRHECGRNAPDYDPIVGTPKKIMAELQKKMFDWGEEKRQSLISQEDIERAFE